MSDDDNAGRRGLVQQLTQAGAAAGRDFTQTAKYAAGRDQIVREFHLHLEHHGEGEAPALPAWVADPSTDDHGVFGVPLFPNDHFSGRDAALHELAEAIAPLTPPRFLVIAGAAGVGKTQLAVEYAYKQRKTHDIIWWVRADHPATLVSDFVGLAAHGPLGLEAGVRPDRPADEQATAVRGWLERHDGWLLVFDNAHDLSALRALLPRAGDGRVVMTSRRETGWEGIARVMPLDVLAPETASAFLRQRSGDDDVAAASELAAELGYLPLALEQAGAFIRETAGFGLASYLHRFRFQSKDLLDRGAAYGYEGTINTTWNLSFAQLRTRAPDAIELLALLSFLDPDDIPNTLIFNVLAELNQKGEGETEGAGGHAPSDALELADLITALRAYGLVTAAGDGLFVHRLLQTVVRNGLEPDDKRSWASVAVALVATPFLDQEDVTTPASQRLIPHALAVAAHAEQLEVEPQVVSYLLDQSGRYFDGRGQYSQAVELFRRALTIDEKLGADASVIIPDRQVLGLALLRHGDLASARTEFQASIELADQALDVDDPVWPVLYGNLGMALRAQGDLTAAQAEFERAIELGERILDADDSNLVPLYNNRGLVMLTMGDWSEAQHEFSRVLELGERILGPDHPDLVLVHNNLGSALSSLGDLDSALTECERAIELGERTLGPEHPGLILAHSNLGAVLQSQGDIERARTESERAIELGERTLGPEHPDLVLAHYNLGNLLKTVGNSHEAQSEFERAIEVGERTLGRNHPDLLPPYNNLGTMYEAQGDLVRARSMFERSIELAERAFGPNHQSLVMPYSNLGVVLADEGNPEAARAECERAIELGERTLGTDHPGLVPAYVNLGMVRQLAGDLEGARIALERAIELGEQTLGPDHPDLVTQRVRLGAVLQAKGDLDGARNAFERAIELGERVLGPEHPHLAMHRVWLGTVLQEQGDLAGARRLFEEAIEHAERVLGPDHPDLVRHRDRLGTTLMALGDLEAAQAEFRRAVELGERVLPATDIGTGYAAHRLGQVDRQLGDLTNARADFSRALVLLEAALGKENVELRDTLFSLARAEREANDPASARGHLERALVILEVAPGLVDVAPYHVLLGEVLCDLGEYELAKADLSRAQALITKAQGEDSSTLGRVLEDLGRAATGLHDLPGAKASLEWALALTRATSTDDPRVTRILSSLQPILDSLATPDAAAQESGHPDRIEEILPGQRQAIFELRRRALQDDDIRPDIQQRLAEGISAYVAAFVGDRPPADWDLPALAERTSQRYGFNPRISDIDDPSRDRGHIAQDIYRQAVSAWDARVAAIDSSVVGPFERIILTAAIDDAWPKHRDASARHLKLLSASQDDVRPLGQFLNRSLHELLCSTYLRLLMRVEVTIDG